jgi:hypothetical protein
VSTSSTVTAMKMGELQTFASIKSDLNPKGLFAVSIPEVDETSSFCLATPFDSLGKVRIQWFNKAC